MLMNRRQHIFIRMRPGDLQHLRMPLENPLRLRAEAAGDDHPPVLLERFADGIERFIHRGIDEAARVDHHHVGGVVAGSDFVPFGTKLA